MRDTGFTPRRGKRPVEEVRSVLRASIEHGLGNRPVRWMMLAAPFTGGVTIYAFYAMQPYLLELYGNERAYGVAGLAAAIVAGAQIAGGLLVPHLGRVFRRRTTVLLAGTALSTVALAMIGLVPQLLDRASCSWSCGSRVRRRHARAPGVPERPHPFRGTRDRAVVRLAARLDGRIGPPAHPGQDG